MLWLLHLGKQAGKLKSLPEANALMGRLQDQHRLAGWVRVPQPESQHTIMSCELDGLGNVEYVSPTLGSYPSLGSDECLCCSAPEVAEPSRCEICLPSLEFLLGTSLGMSRQILSLEDRYVLTAHPHSW